MAGIEPNRLEKGAVIVKGNWNLFIEPPCIQSSSQGSVGGGARSSPIPIDRPFFRDAADRYVWRKFIFPVKGS